MMHQWKTIISPTVSRDFEGKRPTLDEQLSSGGIQPGTIWDAAQNHFKTASKSNGNIVYDSLKSLERGAQPKRRSLEEDLDDKPTGRAFTTPLERVMDQKKEAYGNTDKKTKSKRRKSKKKKK